MQEQCIRSCEYTDGVISFTVEVTGDETTPNITDTTKNSFSTTESVVLSVSTDENAYCKYDTVDEDYSEMGNILSETAGTGHQVDLGILEAGDYTFYVRCMDEEGNSNSSGTMVEFEVTEAAVEDTTPPTIISDDNNGQTYKTGEDVTLGVTTNETANCMYNENEDMNYGNMTSSFSLTDGTRHTKWFGDSTAFSTNEYTLFVRCEDSSQNESNSRKISFLVTPVVIVGSDYSSGKLTVTGAWDDDTNTLSITTDVDADCGYNSGSDIAYGSMTPFTTTDGTEHSSSIVLADDKYTYYIRCQDTSGVETPVGAANSFEATTAQLNTENSTDFYAAQDFPAADTKNIFSMSLETVGNLFISTAIAQDDTSTTTTTDSSTDTTDADTEDSDFLEEGGIEEGSGAGKFTSKLEDLKPGTFFYARAYAVVGGTTYYGNQIGFRTADSCFVATAAYGSLFHPAVQLLRDFRDRFMLDNPVSRSLVHLYYRYSPPIADVISSNTILRPVTKTLLLPIVGSAWLTMRFGWLWLILPAAAMVMVSWFGMQRMQAARKEELS